jgi:hypothetical protein
MKALVNSLVDRQISGKEKQSKKALLKAVRKKSLGGAKAAKTPPGKQNSGGRPNGMLKNNKQLSSSECLGVWYSFGTPHLPNHKLFL